MENTLDMDLLHQKLLDAETPGVAASFTHEEMEFLGAFDETAVPSHYVDASTYDRPDLLDAVASRK